jgi:ADP-ribose pyrophosphatase YjhB (NUDIX family)
MKKISFDFDNTIAMGFMTYVKEKPVPVFQSYNDKIIKKIKKHIKEGDDIYIVTARTEDYEQYFPDQTVERHLEKLGLKEYFWPDKVIFTSGGKKVDILHNLGVEKHYDDSIEEHRDALEAKYEIIQPLDDYKDSETVGKVAIYDKSGRILILQRSDEGHLWDLPGGHLKNIEIARGEQGLDDGTEREVFEETGIMVPFLKEFMVYDFNHKGLTHKIHMFLSRIDQVTPHVRLDLQDHVENIDYKWVTLDNLEYKMSNSTTNLRKAYDELSVQDEILSETEAYQLKMKKNHRNMKKKLIGLGKNKHFGGGKGYKRADLSRSKSAPAPFGVFEEQIEEKNTKKIKIKIKTTKNTEELEEKRKKRRKKRKKTTKKQGIGGYYPYYDLYDSGNSGDSGGDGGE